jgi:hypothetical protein
MLMSERSVMQLATWRQRLYVSKVAVEEYKDISGETERITLRTKVNNGLEYVINS